MPVAVKAKLNVVPTETIPVEDFDLSADQAKTLPEYFAIRDDFNVVSKQKDELTKLLGLPKFEGKKVNVRLKYRGKLLGVVEVRYREGYPVLACWINKTVQAK